jgi:hypothetical protein
MAIGGLDDDRSQAAQLFVQQSGGAIARHGSKGIATDQFGQICGMVGGTAAIGTHFVEGDRDTRTGNLPSGFGSGESATDDDN